MLVSSLVDLCALVDPYLIMLKCPVSADNSILCFSEPSLLGVALLCLSGPETVPDLRDMLGRVERLI